MIDNKEKLKECLEYESVLYIEDSRSAKIRLRLSGNQSYLIWHYLKMLRKAEYYYNTGKKLRYFWYQRRKNREGLRLGITISLNCAGKGLMIYHYGSIIINEYAKIGENCRLHGNNCIGNKGCGCGCEAPVLGDNCELGVGAVVIGNITLGNNVIVGANAVVTKTFLEQNTVLAGIPAKMVHK